MEDDRGGKFTLLYVEISICKITLQWVRDLKEDDIFLIFVVKRPDLDSKILRVP